MRIFIILGVILEVLVEIKARERIKDYQDSTDLKRKAAETRRRIAHLKTQTNEKRNLTDITSALNEHTKVCPEIKDIVKKHRRNIRRSKRKEIEDLDRETPIIVKKTKRTTRSHRGADNEEESEDSSDSANKIPERKESSRFYYKNKRASHENASDEESESTEESSQSKE
ncbi:hypothetical protein NEFER03_0679 [Nematocida sp. LUAm3]|nr:hypothetical protein NEFER03_0679 [Nematocida sp. LUAm3]KAI5175138.1 hypothetical protein NEFER02_1099 [Nematocida sp. LUAm2]KAI5178190.1 hypothetical protein NEFER01_1368 [Nematocida sp. LUAm1]